MKNLEPTTSNNSNSVGPSLAWPTDDQAEGDGKKNGAENVSSAANRPKRLNRANLKLQAARVNLKNI